MGMGAAGIRFGFETIISFRFRFGRIAISTSPILDFKSSPF